jgi:hypothetical protein
MAIREQVSGMGANASRTDKNLSERVARVQRDAKVQKCLAVPMGSVQKWKVIACWSIY